MESTENKEEISAETFQAKMKSDYIIKYVCSIINHVSKYLKRICSKMKNIIMNDP